tara:strand:- start:311 stop:700 length:390 start_codon:yes stop_codon:yes gene_type:complete
MTYLRNPHLIVVEIENEGPLAGEWYSISVPFFETEDLENSVALVVPIVYGPSAIISQVNIRDGYPNEYEIAHKGHVSHVILQNMEDEHGEMNRDVSLLLIRAKDPVRSEEGDAFLRTLVCGDWLLEEAH